MSTPEQSPFPQTPHEWIKDPIGLVYFALCKFELMKIHIMQRVGVAAYNRRLKDASKFDGVSDPRARKLASQWRERAKVIRNQMILDGLGDPIDLIDRWKQGKKRKYG